MPTRRIGYARVSTRDQNLDLQLDALKKAGCDKIYKDTISGTKSQRPGLEQALDTLRDGDTLVVWKLDRLGRNVKDLLDFAGSLNNRGVGFVSLPEAIDTTTVSGHFQRHGLPGPDGTRTHGRTHTGRTADRTRTRQGRRPERYHVRCQDPFSPQASEPGNSSQRSRRYPRRLRAYPLPMGPGSKKY